MKIALASPPFPKSVNDGLFWLEKLVKEAAEEKAGLICFPESFIPGYPLLEFKVDKAPEHVLEDALQKACSIACRYRIGMILPMDQYAGDGFFNVAYVISAGGEIIGQQAKNQLDPSEDHYWDTGTGRSIFEMDGLKFGIVICHEGFRYPELVRWAARNGASVVFHPHCAGSNSSGVRLSEWGSAENPYYEKAMMMRALENTIYFASVNYAFDYPESATSLIGPDGNCLAFQPYGQPGVLLQTIDPGIATGYLAKRFKPGLLT